jgi:hypothetical protein
MAATVLVVAAELARANGGMLTTASPPGTGARLTRALPRA